MDHSSGASKFGLQVSPDANVSNATYTISGPNGFASAGTVPVGTSADVPVTLSELPVGQGYELSLDAIASDGITACDGNTVFDVSSGDALTLVVHLSCAVPTGDVSFVTSLNFCPVLDGLDARPTSLKLGGLANLSMVAHDSDNGPQPISYAWMANGFKLPKQSASTLNFLCSSRGEVTITASVSDGDPSPLCADSLDVKVSCQ